MVQIKINQALFLIFNEKSCFTSCRRKKLLRYYLISFGENPIDYQLIQHY